MDYAKAYQEGYRQAIESMKKMEIFSPEGEVIKGHIEWVYEKGDDSVGIPEYEYLVLVKDSLWLAGNQHLR